MTDEETEVRDTLIVFVPAILVAFVVHWALMSYAGWESRRSLLTSIGIGIVLALILQRAVTRVD